MKLQPFGHLDVVAGLLLLPFTACSSAPAPLGAQTPTEASDVLTARNAKTAGWLTMAGQPCEADLETLAASGTTCVINMRTADEMAGVEFDEAAEAESLGMRYVWLPVSGVESYTDELFAEARAALRECRQTGVLMH